MNIKQIDAIFKMLLASPGCTPEDLASFIYTYYREYSKAVARHIIKMNYPAMNNLPFIAEEAAEHVINSQVRKAMDKSFSYKGKARYSTYLYKAVLRQVPRVYNKSVIKLNKTQLKRLRLESTPREEFEIPASERAGNPVLLQVYRSTLLEGLNECLAKLEPLQAKLATLVYVRGLTPTEACRLLGVRSPSYSWKLLQGNLRSLLKQNDLPSLYAAYREQCE